ncbi:MAG: dTDP-glucose 4,6-dehydratase [Planctomycetaceae bacterium]|nr:dTDP-glucose 4,6-dehydratase [Planctomycetaceae bacterium]
MQQRPLRSILVTGGAGFIGSEFVRQTLRTSDALVVNLDKLTYAGNLGALKECAGNSRYHFVQGDITDRELARSLLQTHECDSVVNFAAESHVDRSIGQPLEFTRTNVLGTCELLDASFGYWRALPPDRADNFRFVQISTDEVYGSLGTEGSFTETSPCAPNSPYSASKAAADHFARAYFQTYGLPTVIARASNNYGPFQQPEKLIPLMIVNALEGRPLPVYGDGSNVREWLHVCDFCAAVTRILERGEVGETYNVGGNCERSNLEIVQSICEVVDRSSESGSPATELIEFVADRPGHDFRYALESSKLRGELGWQTKIEFEDGLAETIAWYMDRYKNQDPLVSGSLHRQRLGLERKG